MPEQVLVVVDLQVGVVPSLEQDLLAADREDLLDLRVDHLVREDVDLVVVRRAVEGAEGAECVAGVRVVDVPVDDVSDDAVRVEPPARGVGEGAEREEVRLLEQAQRLVGSDAPSREDRLQDRIERPRARWSFHHKPIIDQSSRAPSGIS
jgi:hypothetical protein